MFWGFGYFNNPFIMNTFCMPVMPNFFFNFGFNNFGFNNFGFPGFFMPAFLPFRRPVYNYPQSIFRPQTFEAASGRQPAAEVRREKTKKSEPIITQNTGNVRTTHARKNTAEVNNSTVLTSETTVSESRKKETIITYNPIKKTTKRTAQVTHKTTSKTISEITSEQVSSNRNTGIKDSDFLKKTKEVAKKINCDYKDLLALMNSESNLNSKAVNSSSGATGLIQFTPATAKELGTTTEELKKMSPVEQLDYVEKYLVKFKKAAGFKKHEKLDSGDLYALVFLPGRAKREIITDASEIYYKPNAPALDINNDGKITKTELAQRMSTHRVNESIFLA